MSSDGEQAVSTIETCSRPSHRLTPQQLVRLIVTACRTSPEDGAAALWKFGSERLKASAGGTLHLARHLGNELFRPLLDHDEAVYEPLQQRGGAARQIVRLHSCKHGDCAFLFALARSPNSEGASEGAGCWRVSGVERE